MPAFRLAADRRSASRRSRTGLPAALTGKGMQTAGAAADRPLPARDTGRFGHQMPGLAAFMACVSGRSVVRASGVQPRDRPADAETRAPREDTLGCGLAGSAGIGPGRCAIRSRGATASGAGEIGRHKRDRQGAVCGSLRRYRKPGRVRGSGAGLRAVSDENCRPRHPDHCRVGSAGPTPRRAVLPARVADHPRTRFGADPWRWRWRERGWQVSSGSGAVVPSHLASGAFRAPPGQTDPCRAGLRRCLPGAGGLVPDHRGQAAEAPVAAQDGDGCVRPAGEVARPVAHIGRWHTYGPGSDSRRR